MNLANILALISVILIVVGLHSMGNSLRLNNDYIPIVSTPSQSDQYYNMFTVGMIYLIFYSFFMSVYHLKEMK